jgi:3-oxoacyl-[acyl-carrier protein] reductase
MLEIDLTRKKALVCGSTQGIGKACAIQMASAGASVTLLARNQNKLKDTIEFLPASNGQQHGYLTADFFKPESLRREIENYLSEHEEPYHILVNNSGGPAPGKAIEASSEDYRIAFNQHLICNQILAQALVPGMKKETYGRIINIISTSVRTPIPGLGVSNTIRGAVASWSKTISVELAPFGITVNNILPGFTDTERLQSLIKSKASEAGITVDEMTTQMQNSVPNGRFADADEPAYLASFLASPLASYLNGSNIAVDGVRTPSI